MKNQQAFKAMYEACLPYVFTIVKGYTDNPDSQKDLVQEIFAKLFLNIQSYDAQRGEFKFWLRKIAVNQCLMFLRDKKKQWDFADVDNLNNAPHEYMSLGHLDPNASEQVLAQMPNGYRRVFKLVVFEGYTHDEVGQALGISSETSRSQLARSKEWLRQFFINNKTLIKNGFY
ncbi:MAG: sigma-70 family RNA polymerase sigma factor [Bacteroidetes bacterium]|nr:sigma-70 family RNA polymerase sigma factor [Bacteroidota bacterium]